MFWKCDGETGFTKVIQDSWQIPKYLKTKNMKGVPAELCFNFYLHSAFGVAAITASPRRVISKERVLSADPSRALIQSLSYEMRTKWTIFQACKYVTNGSAGTIDSNHDDTMLHSQTRLCLYKRVQVEQQTPAWQASNWTGLWEDSWLCSLQPE